MNLEKLTLSADMTGVQYDVRVCGVSVGFTEKLVTALQWHSESKADAKSKEIIVLSTSK